MSALRSVSGRPLLPYLMAAIMSLLIGLAAFIWALESRTAARTEETARLVGLSKAFGAHVELTLSRYIDLLERAAVFIGEDQEIPLPRLLSEMIAQTPYMVGARIMEGPYTVIAVEGPDSMGVVSWPEFHGSYGAVDHFDFHVHDSGLLHLHRYLPGDVVIEFLIDRQALLDAMAPLIDTPQRSVGLFTTEGLILARVPPAPGLRQAAVLPPDLNDSGRLIETRLSPFDGLERLIAWTRVGDHPLLLAATVPVNALFADWRRQVFLVALVWIALTLGAAVIASRFSRASSAAEAAVRALRHNEAELATLFHQNLQYLGLLEVDGRIRRVNQTALASINARHEDLAGLPFADTPWWKDEGPLRDRLIEALAAARQGQTSRFISSPQHPDARGASFDVSVVPIIEPAGTVTGILVEGRDITDRLKAERDAADQRQRLELALETTEQGIWDWNIAAGTVEYSDQLLTMLGYRPGDWPPHVSAWEERVHPDDLRFVRQALTDHMEGRAPLYETEHRMRRRDGGWGWILDKGKIVEWDAEGRPLRAIGTHADITVRRQGEERLRRLAQELEDSNRNLEQFAYVASHDLQEPLRMVSSYLGLLRHRKSDQLDAEALEFIGFASDGAVRMSQLITDLLDYSRVTTRGAPFRHVPLAEPIDRSLSNLTIALQESGARVEVPDDLPVVTADSWQLTQLFQNLIGNAIKYARPGTPPVVRIEVETRPTGWRITVRDNGIGIEPPYRTRIFRIFQRLHNRENFAGTGIGLAVAQRIVERHGGGIRVEDAVPGDWSQGSAFIVDLPHHDAEDDAMDQSTGGRFHIPA